MNKEKQTPQVDFTPDNVPRGPIHGLDFTIPGQRQAPAEWQGGLGLEDVVLTPNESEAGADHEGGPDESIRRELGGVAVGADPETATAEEEAYSEAELEELLDSRTFDSEAEAIAAGYTESLPIEYRIFEPVDMPGFGGVRNRLAHVLLLNPDMHFILKDGGHEPRFKPDSPDSPDNTSE